MRRRAAAARRGLCSPQQPLPPAPAPPTTGSPAARPATAHVVEALAVWSGGDGEGEGLEVGLHVRVAELLAHQPLQLAHRVARVGGHGAHCGVEGGRGRGDEMTSRVRGRTRQPLRAAAARHSAAQDACCPLAATPGCCGATHAPAAIRHGSCRQRQPQAVRAAAAGGSGSTRHCCAPASVPMNRILLLKLITLAVSRLLSLFRITSTPARSQRGVPEGRRSAAAAAAVAGSPACSGDQGRIAFALPPACSPQAGAGTEPVPHACRPDSLPCDSPPFLASAIHELLSPTSMPAHAMVIQADAR